MRNTSGSEPVGRRAALLACLGLAAGCATTPEPQEGWPPPCPEELRPWIGEYGDPDAPAIVAEWAEGTLRVIRPEHDDAYLRPIPDQLLFVAAGSGAIWKGAVDAAGGRRLRTPEGETLEMLRRFPEHGVTFRIEPRFGPDELRARAAAAEPPAPEEGLRAPDLVPVADFAPGVVFDIRYATTDNFLGTALYDRPIALLQRPAAEALGRVQQRLARDGLGLIVYDAYRPWRVTYMFWDATPEAQRAYVANPATGSRHNRGCAVDLGLVDLATGEPLEMPSGFDEFTARAHPGYRGGTVRQRWAAWMLSTAMQFEGFQPIGNEWWHFDHRDWRKYPVLDVPLEAAASGS